MTLLQFLILSLATYRISNLLIDESGPFELLDIFRYKIGVRHNDKNIPYGLNQFAELFTCIYCLSIWIGVVITVSYTIIPEYTSWLCLPFALSSIAIGLHKYAE